MRLFSALASAATIPLVYLLGRAFGPPATGLAAALLFALMPMQLFYAQEVRTYALLPLFFATALLGLLHFTRTATAQDRTGGWQGLPLFTISALLLIYSHATSVFTVAALDICCAGLLLVSLAFLLGVPALLLATVIGPSFKSPFLIPRITIWIAVPVCVLTALALHPPVPRMLRAALALAFVACIGVGLHGVYARTPTDKEDWRGLVAELMPRLAPQDILAVGPGSGVLPLLHYSGGVLERTQRQIWRWVPAPRDPDIYLVARELCGFQAARARG